MVELEAVLCGIPMLLTSSRHGTGAVVTALTEITSLHRRMQDLEQRSFTDELTGVANRGLFMRLLVQTLSGAERSKARTAVLFIDVDNFKAVNDTHGHAAGDAVLVEIAGAVAQRVLALCSAPLSLGGRSVGVSVSVGVTVEDPGADPEHSVGRADTAMYAAKAAGRATSVTWSPRLDDGRPADDRTELAALQAVNRELRTRYEQVRDEARRDSRTGSCATTPTRTTSERWLPPASRSAWSSPVLLVPAAGRGDAASHTLSDRAATEAATGRAREPGPRCALDRRGADDARCRA